MFALPLFHSPASLHPSCYPPPSPQPLPWAQPPLWYSQSHLQSDIFNGLITLSSHSLIEHLTSTPHPLRPQCSLFTSTHSRTSNAFLLTHFSLFLSCFLSSLSLVPFSHLISSKPLPSNLDPTVTSFSLKWPQRSSPHSLGYGASLIRHRLAGSSPWSPLNIGITLIEELT